MTVSMAQPGNSIVSAVKARGVVLFCGAGISIDPPATLPDWKTLRDETIRAVASVDDTLAARVPALLDQSIIGRSGGGLAPELVATIVRAVVPSYFQSLRVLDHDQPNGNHRLIAQLACARLVSTIITTNFDQLIEKALDSAGVSYRVRRSDADFAAFAGAPGAGAPVELLKLHGCISDPDTIVATVEQEAVGLSMEKGRVLAALWRDFVTLFWGYSGADLKLDLDYLRMTTAASTARGFFWNLFANDSFRETPNEYVQELVSRYTGRGFVCHETLAALLGPLVDHKPEPNAPFDAIVTLRAARGAQLAASLRDWAGHSVRPAHAQEIFGRLHESTGALAEAVACYGQLASIASREKRTSLEALAFARGGELLASLGQWKSAEQTIRRADDLARTCGSIDIDLLEARSLGLADVAQGYLLRSTQPRAFARLLSRWATPRVAADALIVELDTADYLMLQRQSSRALELYRSVEAKARAAGRLVTVVDVLARRARAHAAVNHSDDVAVDTRAGADLARALGRHADVALFDIQLRLCDAAAITPEQRAGFSSVLKTAANERIACELALDLCELELLSPEDVPGVLDRVEAYVESGGHHLRVRLAVQRSVTYRKSGDAAQELATITAVRPLLARSGNEAPAILLYQRLADLQEALGRPPADVLASLQSAAAISRRAFGMSASLEERLAAVRRRISGAAAIEFDAFVDEWRNFVPSLDHLLPVLASYAGVQPAANIGDALSSKFGPDARFAWLLWGVAVACRQLRTSGQPIDAFNLANGSIGMALSLDDHQLAAVLMNECGLNLMALEKPDVAFEAFRRAAAASEQAGDFEEAIEDLFNAGRALRELKKTSDAVAYLNRAFAHVEERQDLVRGAALSLEAGEAGKELGDNNGSLENFEHAQYLAWTLGDRPRMEQAAMRLAKVHWNLGAFEESIAYRHQLVEWQRERGDVAAATPFAFLIGNTYEEKIGRPDDALVYYRLAQSLNEQTHSLDATDLSQRIKRCEQASASVPMRCWTVLCSIAESMSRAERTAAQMAMAMDFNLWRFEPRSFGAWYERAFPGSVPYPHEGDAETPIWRFALVHQLLALGRAAQDMHDHAESLLVFRMADEAAKLLGIAQGSYLAHSHMASLYDLLGDKDSAAAERDSGGSIRNAFDVASRATGITDRTAADKTFTPWQLLGVRLAVATHAIPDLTLRHTIVKGRMNYEFRMDD